MFVYPGGSVGRAQTVFEIVVAEAGQRLGGAVFMQHPDIRQGHPVEGVVLAGGIDGHVAENEPVTLGEGPPSRKVQGFSLGSPASSRGGR